MTRPRLNPSAGNAALVVASSINPIVGVKTAPLQGGPLPAGFYKELFNALGRAVDIDTLRERWLPSFSSLPPRGGDYRGGAGCEDSFSSLLSPRFRAASIEQRAAVAVLIVAVVLGGYLRCSNLGRYEMSADEGASWAAASASSVRQVLQLQPRLNPGKFAIHEICLHGWIRFFGDGLVAMRAFSALAGTLGIVLVFLLARELFGLSPVLTCRASESVFGDRAEASSHLLSAAFAAVLFAVNLVFIKYAREARMYSVALLCGMAQIGFFLRSVRRTSPLVLLFTGLFTALAIATTFTMCLILAPEALWLAYLVWNRTINSPAAMVGLALISGLVLLIPPATIYLGVRAQAPPLLAYAWASPPAPWAPISMFNKATGSFAFPVLLGLAVWGVTRGWHPNRAAIVFVLLWMLVPPILVLAGSYLIRPAFVERYMLASFIPFFLLVVLGIRSVHGLPAQFALFVVAALLSVGHVYSYRSHAHDVQWREAVQASTSINGRTIAVEPPYAADVVRYYLRNSDNRWSVAPGYVQTASVAIVADSGVSPSETAGMATAYPRLLMRLRGVIVRGH